MFRHGHRCDDGVMPKRTPTPTSTPFGIAACSLAITPGRELQLLPAGSFRGRDGRPFDAPGWFIDGALAQRLIAAADARGTPYVLDYEHQTLLAKDNGQPAPAAGWFKQLEWRDGVGLFAVDVEWTDRAAGMIAADEYRYISPVIGYDKPTGAVTSLYMAAATNNPAIDGMSEVLLEAAALHFSLSQPTPLPEEVSMNIEELLEQLRWMLNLPVGAPAEDIKAHLQKLIDQIKTDNPTATAAASFDLIGHLARQCEQVASLSAATPDPAKFVPVATMTALQGQVAALSAELNEGRVDKAVKDALAAGKLLPAQEPWAREFGTKDFAALSAYLGSAPPIAILSGMQSNTVTPPKGGTAALTANQKDLCRMTGVSEEDFLKTLQSDTAS
jgi:phage I-like protein